MRARKLEFGICGLDITYPRDRLGKLFQRPDACRVEPELEAFGPLTKSYIILHDTETFGTEDEPIHDDGTLFSHRRKQKILKNQQAYHVGKLMHSQAASSLEDLDLEHVEEALRDAQADLEQLGSGLQVAIEGWLKGPSDAGDEQRNDRFKARHIQINVSARGVDPTLFSVGEGTLSSETVVKLAARYPETIFLLSVFERDGVTSWPWVRQTLDLSRGARAASATHARTLQNLAAFFDDSGGLGIQPTEVPEIPVGGLEVSKRCRRYEERAQEAECWCISDAQSGFRVEHSRSKPIDAEKLEDMVKRIYEPGAETGDRTLQDLREEAQKKLETLDESELLEFVTNSTEKQDSLTFSASMGYGDIPSNTGACAPGPTSRGGSRQEFQRDLDQVEAKFRSTLGTEGLTRQRWMMLLMKAGCASQDAKAHSISVRSFFYLLRGKVADPEASV
eukprot:g384.t1